MDEISRRFRPSVWTKSNNTWGCTQSGVYFGQILAVLDIGALLAATHYLAITQVAVSIVFLLGT